MIQSTANIIYFNKSINTLIRLKKFGAFGIVYRQNFHQYMYTRYDKHQRNHLRRTHSK